jgi:hypothetical protein
MQRRSGTTTVISLSWHVAMRTNSAASVISCSACHTGATTRQHWQPDGSVELEVIAAVQSAAPGYSGVLHASIASCTAHATVPVTLPSAGSHFISARVIHTAGCVQRVL